jgi:hypothetical protein
MAKKLKGVCKALMSLKEARFEDDGNVFDKLLDEILDNIFTRCRQAGGEVGRPSDAKPLANIRLVNTRFAEGGFRCLTTVVVPREGFQKFSLQYLRNTVKVLGELTSRAWSSIWKIAWTRRRSRSFAFLRNTSGRSWSSGEPLSCLVCGLHLAKRWWVCRAQGWEPA